MIMTSRFSLKSLIFSLYFINNLIFFAFFTLNPQHSLAQGEEQLRLDRLLKNAEVDGNVIGVVITQSPELTSDEKAFLKNEVINVLSKNGKYNIIDIDISNKVLEDKILAALTDNNFQFIANILQKPRFDYLININASVECVYALGGFFLASAKVSMSWKNQAKNNIFRIVSSEPQNGYYGMPEWIGTTADGARQIALKAALIDCFRKEGIDSNIQLLPIPMEIIVHKDNSIYGKNVDFVHKIGIKRHEILKEIRKVLERYFSQSRNFKITTVIMDKSRRIVLVGSTEIDIDIQRRLRTDTAKVVIIDWPRRRVIKEMVLPRKIKGIRRPRSRDIISCAFAPSYRFIGCVSKHPALFIYDILGGAFLNITKLNISPLDIDISADGNYLRVQNTMNKYDYYKIKALQEKDL